ncbi:Adenine-specific methyltransferase [Lysobacter dokdonensis DS-58]|uniref:Methyltransferase n=2 Tax=Noviluteimonas TaxID=3382693 RepID=A0A0A2X3S5_9GAMM|nr:Adenine-specific methyltransferase [Lysobacter dokdonensis DS-58]
MGRLPSNSVDLILCDLPYGTTSCKWDSVIPFDALWSQYRRIAKRNAAIVLTANQPFTTALIASNLCEFRYTWVWDKVNRPTGFLNAKLRPLRAFEDVCVFYRAQPTYNPQKWRGEPYKTTHGSSGEAYHRTETRTQVCADGMRYPQDLIRIKADNRGVEGRVHPTQKPVALMEYLVKTYSNEGDTVLDNCMGSGTTGVACANTGRRFIGIERDADYFTIASKRVGVAGAKPRVWVPLAVSGD